MFPAAFKYAAPSSVADAVALLHAGRGEAKVLAGGHSLLPLMKLRLAQPAVLVDINRIEGLRYIREDRESGRLRIGALTRHVDLERSELIRSLYPLLHDAAGGIGDPQVRNRGTLAGSLAHGDPASDWPAVVLATGGEVVAVGPDGERTIPTREFVIDTFQTELAPDEIVTEVRLPLAEDGSGGAYEKLERKVGDYAIVGVAVQLALDADGNVASIGLGLCNVGATGLRAEAAEEFLRGKPPAPDNLNQAAQLAMEASQPYSDDRGPEDYKRAMVKELTKRALSRALTRARGGVA
jgi:aerobic carbon-monoxide dehydrogenase medium subunit